MLILKDIENINEILKSFYEISGFRVSIHDIDHNEIYAYPKKNSKFCSVLQVNKDISNQCKLSDVKAFEIVEKSGKPYYYTCNCGLIEAVSPIYNYGVLTGFLMIGQVRIKNSTSKKNILKLSRKYFSSDKGALNLINSIKPIEENKIDYYIYLMTVIAEYITHTNKLSYDKKLAVLVREYININYQKDISLDILSQKFDCCKSTLLNHFKKEFGISIGNYITEIRLKKTLELLTKSNKSMKEISFICGFSDQNYVSKVFSKTYNCSPSEFRAKKKLK